ncbi:MAG: ABC transporter substrate-binding protein [Candidatus Rokubacteria bacterium]|nr:ABC transporter substrate-binding protein [Candidatus Rokubacteria bacterium]MBI3826663.1 ABC transporter substrate-binding protein [Candidatus Rokubacteria bacterium]
MSWTRRELLALGGAALGGAALPTAARAQTPKRGGTASVRIYDPPHFDHMLIISFKTNIALSFTHSRLVKHKTGPGVAPGTFPLEGDLAESWTQPNDTTYVFKLRRGVKWHHKPPVNGRELTAEDVKYTLERFVTVKGNSNAYMLRPMERVEAVDRYTVKVTLKEPFAWFLDMLASPMAIAVVAKECVDKFGDLKKAEAVIGTGPWMLDSYKPNQSLTFVRNPNYFLPGLPHIDRVEGSVDEDTSSRLASFTTGKYDIGVETVAGNINKVDWVQIKDALKQKRPGLKVVEFPGNVMSHVSMRTDQKPFSDVRVRQAMSLAVDRQGLIDAVLEGAGVFNAAVPAALKEWALPVAQLGEGARYFKHDPAEARRLLAAAGYANGFTASICFTTYGSTVLIDSAQLILKSFKDVGISATLEQKEYGAYIATCFNGNFPSMTYGPQTPFLEPDNFLFAQYYPEEPKNQSHIHDPVVADMLVRQRRTFDVAKRRDIIHEIQRYLAKQQYYVQVPSAIYTSVWDGALKNYAPNLGYDIGGRLTAAWLDR